MKGTDIREEESIQEERFAYFLYNISSILLLALIRTALQCSLNLCLDLLSKLCNELDVDVRFQKRRADLLQESI